MFTFDIEGVEAYRVKDITQARILKYNLNIYNIKCLIDLVLLKI